MTSDLWATAKDAFFGEESISQCLSRLDQDWDDLSDHLLWDRLCHQETLYEATFAVVPHINNFAVNWDDQRRDQLVIFLAVVLAQSFTDSRASGGTNLEDLSNRGGEWGKVAALFEASRDSIVGLTLDKWADPASEGFMPLAGAVLIGGGHSTLGWFVYYENVSATCSGCKWRVDFEPMDGGLKAYHMEPGPRVGQMLTNGPVPPIALQKCDPTDALKAADQLLSARDDKLLRAYCENYGASFSCPNCGVGVQLGEG